MLDELHLYRHSVMVVAVPAGIVLISAIRLRNHHGWRSQRIIDSGDQYLFHGAFQYRSGIAE